MGIRYTNSPLATSGILPAALLPKPASLTSSPFLMEGRLVPHYSFAIISQGHSTHLSTSLSSLYHQLLALLSYCQFALNCLRSPRHFLSDHSQEQAKDPRCWVDAALARFSTIAFHCCYRVLQTQLETDPFCSSVDLV